MKTRARGIRLPEQLADEVEREQVHTVHNFSETIGDLVEEAVRMRRVPGIVFRSGPTGRPSPPQHSPTRIGTRFGASDVIRFPWAESETGQYGEFRQYGPVRRASIGSDPAGGPRLRLADHHDRIAVHP